MLKTPENFMRSYVKRWGFVPSSFDFDGLDELTAKFQEMGRDVEKVDNQALKAGGEIIAQHQKANVNRSNKNQAHIQDNLTVSRPKENDDGKFVEVGPSKKVAWRAKFLEYGTSKMPPYPFIEKGADEGAEEATESMANIYIGAIKK